ncbi:hypothetical protein U0070_008318, partial [Myodes glareolus]
ATRRDRLRRPGGARLVWGRREGSWTLRSLAAPRRARSLAATRGAHSHSLRARLPGAMDAALLHSLLEANCSLALAEELLLDGWGLPPDPEGSYSYCNTTLDQIGTCWPQSTPGALVERPCPEYFNGIKYNTTREYPSHACFPERRFEKKGSGP